MAEQPELGSLDDVDLRAVWPHEASDFTPWVADNLDLLADALRMGGLTLVEQEHRVGPYALDILAKLDDERLVVIENQLERSDHGHLGQCITYAAGVGAYAVVWLLPSLASEHRAALDWLNERTGEDVHFFGVEVSVVRIGESLPAPVFSVVSRPNEWQKRARKNNSKSDSFQSWELAYQALKTLSGPEWTTIGGLAQLIGTSPGWIGRHFYERRHVPETIRMFTDDGSVWPWARHDADDPPTSESIRQELESIGIALSPDGHADSSHYIDADGLRNRCGVADPESD